MSGRPHLEHLVFFFVLALIVSLLYSISDILSPFLLGFVISYLANPLVSRLERLGISRALASVIITLGITALMFSFFFFSVPFVAKRILMILKDIKAASFWIDTPVKTKALLDRVLPSLDTDIKSVIVQAVESLFSFARGGFDSFGDITVSLLRNVTDLAIMLFTPVLVYYTLRDWPNILRNITLLVPRRYLRVFVRSMHDVNRSVILYLKGQAKVSAILCLVYGVLLYFSPLRFGFILGVMTGVCTVMPYIGFAFMAVVVAATTFQELDGNAIELARVLCMLLVGQLLDVGIITPKFMGESINLSPVWMIFGILACGSLFGLAGAFFGLPILVVGSAVVRNVITFYRSSSFYKQKLG